MTKPAETFARGGIFWLASYPKSGNTWLRAFLSNLQADSSKPADINDMASDPIASGRPWIDEVLGFDSADLTDDEVDALRPAVYRWPMQPQASYRKIHDAYGFTPAGEPLVSREGTLGALYVLRNPLDVAPSAAAHWQISLDEAIESMGDEDMALTTSGRGLAQQLRQRLRSWSGHVLSWVDAPGLPRLVIRYEDMLADGPATFAAAAAFLRLPDGPERIGKAIRFSEFKVLACQEIQQGFRERPPQAAAFFRQGRAGGWREQLSDAQVSRILADHSPVMRRFGYLDAHGNPA